MSALPEGHRRTHPLTPLVTGWKIIVGVIAVITAQNLASLLQDFTVQRALIGLGILAVVLVVAIGASALARWAMGLAVDYEGGTRRSGLLSRTRQFAPRERIESVSVERPLLARLLGLAKVRIEVAGGGDSYLDIAYIRGADAELLRRRILEVAAGDAAGPRDTATAPARADGAPAAGPAAPTDAGAPEPAGAPGDLRDRAREILHDGVTDGELIAEIPTTRLVHSLLRDSSFLLGVLGTVLGVVLAVGVAIWQDGLSLAILVPLLPALIAVPRYVFGRIEAGWGFVSRLTPAGLRMRRGLANTRTDNIASGRIQRLALRRPLLWRGPRWTSVEVTVAGIDDEDSEGARSVLPVGTPEELALTLGHLAPPLGAGGQAAGPQVVGDDLALIEQLLTTRARDLPGLRAPHPLQWYARRTVVTVLLPGAVVRRSGLLAHRLEIVPRDRVQELALADGPLSRALGTLDLSVSVAGRTVELEALPRADALALHHALAHDAATARRYAEQDRWPVPALAAGAAGGVR